MAACTLHPAGRAPMVAGNCRPLGGCSEALDKHEGPCWAWAWRQTLPQRSSRPHEGDRSGSRLGSADRTPPPTPGPPCASSSHSVSQPHHVVTEVTPQQVTFLRAGLGVLSGPRKGTLCSVIVKRREMAKRHSVEQGQLRRAGEGPPQRWWPRALPPRGSQGRLGLRGQVILPGLVLKLAGASHPGP